MSEMNYIITHVSISLFRISTNLLLSTSSNLTDSLYHPRLNQSSPSNCQYPTWSGCTACPSCCMSTLLTMGFHLHLKNHFCLYQISKTNALPPVISLSHFWCRLLIKKDILFLSSGQILNSQLLKILDCNPAISVVIKYLIVQINIIGGGLVYLILYRLMNTMTL